MRRYICGIEKATAIGKHWNSSYVLLLLREYISIANPGGRAASSLAESAGSNPTGGMRVVFLIFLLLLSGRGLCVGLITRRVVLPSVVCLSVMCLSVVCLSVMCLSVVCLSVMCLSVVCLSVVCLSVVCLSVVCLSVVCLSVIARLCNGRPLLGIGSKRHKKKCIIIPLRLPPDVARKVF